MNAEIVHKVKINVMRKKLFFSTQVQIYNLFLCFLCYKQKTISRQKRTMRVFFRQLKEKTTIIFYKYTALGEL